MLEKLNTFIKTRTKKVFYTEVLIALVLLSMPFWFVLVESIVAFEKIETQDLVLNNFGFNSFSEFVYFFSIKLTPVVCISVWYFTCNYWWRYGVLVPLIFAIAQLVHMFINDFFIDDKEFIIAFLLSTPIIIIIIIISKKLKFYSSNIDLIKDIKDEIFFLLQNNTDKNSKSLKDIDSQYAKLKRRKNSFSEEKYLIELIALRNKISKEKLF